MFSSTIYVLCRNPEASPQIVQKNLPIVKKLFEVQRLEKKISPSKRVFSQAFSIEEHPPSFFDLQEIEHQDCPVASTRYVLWTPPPPSSFLGISVLICKPRLSSLQASDCDRHKPQMDTRLQIIKYITSTSQMCGSSGRPDVLACQ